MDISLTYEIYTPLATEVNLELVISSGSYGQPSPNYRDVEVTPREHFLPKGLEGSGTVHFQISQPVQDGIQSEQDQFFYFDSRTIDVSETPGTGCLVLPNDIYVRLTE